MKPIKVPKGSFLVNVRRIKVEETRGRKDFKNLDSLMESIQKLGLLQPLVITKFDGGEKYDYKLLAGERRMRAMLMAGIDEVPCSLFEDIKGIEQKEIELEENLRREDLEWTEEIDLQNQLDELKKELALEEGKEWKLADTAEVVGKPQGTVRREVALAKLLKARPDIKEKVKGLPKTVAARQAKAELEKERMKRLQDAGKLKLSSDLTLGSCVDLVKNLPDESVDLVLTDPPFGSSTIEDMRGQFRNGSQSYTQILKDSDNMGRGGVARLFEALAPELHRVMKPGGHIYVFFAHEIEEDLRRTLGKFFSFAWAPLIWDKGRATTVARGYNYMSSYEPILFGFKPPRVRRLNGSERDIQLCSIIQSKDKVHPFEKPQLLLKKYIDMSTNIGDVVLDPFAGSGSTIVAAKSSGRSGIGFELDEDTFMLAQQRLMEK